MDENNNKIEEQKERGGGQKDRFGRGLVTGVVISVLIMGCLTMGWNLFQRMEQGVGLFEKDYESQETVASVQEKTSKVKQIENIINENFLFDVDQSQVEEYIYKGIMAGLGDPYSTYYTEEEFSALMEDIEGVYYGIGVQASQSYETMESTIVQVYENSPAEEAGLKKGDIIYEVNGENVQAQDLNEIVSKIKGEEGTTVHLKCYRPETEEYVDVDVERRSIEMDTVSSEMLSDNIGYIKISSFDGVTADQFKEALNDLEEQQMEGLIIDLRDNLGGLVDSVVEIADWMLPEGTIVYTEDKNGEGETYSSDAEHQFTKPLAVLVNGYSASASEIFAGAIQSYGTGTLVGTKTFGKGIVQNTYPLGDGSAVKMTVSRYFTPDGVCIHGEGIEPDVEVELPEELKSKPVLTSEEDVQLNEAIRVVQEKME